MEQEEITVGSMTEHIEATPSLHHHTAQSNYIFWSLIDGILMLVILSGNILTILALRLSRRLRCAISNQFILSLAVSDLIVGLTLPYHLAFYVGSDIGRDKVWCLLRFVLITLGCCLSIWNLIAIAVDRYIAIVHPLHYGRYMTKTIARSILGFGWIMGLIICSMPLYWNNWEAARACELAEVLPTYFVAGVITPSFSLIWLVMLVVYWRIWREAAGHARRLRATAHNGTPSDWKSVQVVLLILGSFSVCWLPFFVVACAQAFSCHNETSPTLYKAAFSLAIANSGLNPLIYAWKNSNFRRAFAELIRCRNPDTVEQLRQQLNQQSLYQERRMTNELQKSCQDGAKNGVIRNGDCCQFPNGLKNCQDCGKICVTDCIKNGVLKNCVLQQNGLQTDCKKFGNVKVRLGVYQNCTSCKSDNRCLNHRNYCQDCKNNGDTKEQLNGNLRNCNKDCKSKGNEVGTKESQNDDHKKEEVRTNQSQHDNQNCHCQIPIRLQDPEYIQRDHIHVYENSINEDYQMDEISTDPQIDTSNSESGERDSAYESVTNLNARNSNESAIVRIEIIVNESADLDEIENSQDSDDTCAVNAAFENDCGNLNMVVIADGNTVITDVV